MLSRVTCATSVPILVWLGLSVLELGPMYVTDRRQTKTSLNAYALWWRRHNKEIYIATRPYGRNFRSWFCLISPFSCRYCAHTAYGKMLHPGGICPDSAGLCVNIAACKDVLWCVLVAVWSQAVYWRWVRCQSYWFQCISTVTRCLTYLPVSTRSSCGRSSLQTLWPASPHSPENTFLSRQAFTSSAVVTTAIWLPLDCDSTSIWFWFNFDTTGSTSPFDCSLTATVGHVGCCTAA